MTYYKIQPKNLDNYWHCDEAQLKRDIASWADEGEGIRITPVEMTKEQFEALPEYQG